MFFSIDPNSGVPIYEQVVRQVTFAIAAGAIRSGEMVPSVRELARELAVNPNTVARAYRQLQDDGILEGLRGTGLIVSAGAAPRCRSERIAILRQRFREVLEEAKRSRLELKELRALIEDELTFVQREEPPCQP